MKPSPKISGHDPQTGEPLRDRPVVVILIESISYTGTTWLNFVLGSHEDALALGPADRALQLASEPEKVCLLHGKDCSFWPAFYESYEEDGNFFLQLADFSGKNFIVTNNLIPDGAGKHLRHPDIIVRRIRVVRDARAVFSSWMRKFPERSELDCLEEFILPAYRAQSATLHITDPRILFCRYEDVLTDKETWLEGVRRFTSLDYTANSLRYWEYDHHPVSGNQGTLSLLKFARNLPVPDGYKDKSFYEQQFQRAVNNEPFDDDRWRGEISDSGRFLCEIGVGACQRELGYSNESFERETVESLLQNLEGAQPGPLVRKEIVRVKRLLAEDPTGPLDLAGRIAPRRTDRSLAVGRRILKLGGRMPVGLKRMIPGGLRQRILDFVRYGR